MKKQTKLSVRDLKARKDIKGGSGSTKNQQSSVGKNNQSSIGGSLYTSINPKNQS
jgi:hypothetical protein